MTFSSERRGNQAVFHFHERLTAEEVAALREAFWKAFTEEGTRILIVDLGPENTLEPSTISLLAGAQNLATKENAKLYLTGGGAHARALLEDLNLITYFDHHQSLDNLAATLH